ncbi:F-box/kelch-repeat protein-like [Dorcoceras hygrometricum]|uniref:F-box/kelch-repeat protein-like n=1 Tax=Dorcoceras hygrometricum TaxID=472368 RepID=A0A2Z7AQ16_9LAMI|nr:F-box/kelch-repeat protein-like [Dorcoceras hygrometricum]
MVVDMIEIFELKGPYLVTHAMPLFDLQDVCMVIGSLATLDLRMVVDMIEIFELKGPYCMLTMIEWFLQTLSVIPKGSWSDVSRRFTMIRWITPIRSTTGYETPSSPCTRRRDEIYADGFSSSNWPETIFPAKKAAVHTAAACREERGGDLSVGLGPAQRARVQRMNIQFISIDFIITPIADQIGPIDSVSKTEYYDLKNHFSEPQCKMTVLPLNSGKPRTCVTLNGSGIQLAVGPQPLRLRNHNSGLAHRIIVKRLATSPHDLLGITDSACKNQLVVVSVQYGPFNPYIPIRSTTIGKSRVAIDPIAMHTSWRSNSDITNSIGYPRMSASGESSTTMHRLLHASGSHPIPTPYDPKTNQYNQDLGLIHSTSGNHLESPYEGSSIDHQVTIYLHAQNITMFPTNETWYFASQILVSNSGGLILILTAQSTRNMFRIHSDY